MADVFLSYRNEPARRRLVSRLAVILHTYQISVWWDHGLEAGAEFAPQIQKELRRARLICPLWCEESIGSEWVLKEAKIGASRRKLLPIRIQQVLPPSDFQLFQAHDLVNWKGDIEDPRIEDLVQTIRSRTGRRAKAPTHALEELRALPELELLPSKNGKIQVSAELLEALAYHLRAPFQAILGNAEMLQHGLFGQLNARQQEQISSILDASRGVYKTIDAMLDAMLASDPKTKKSLEEVFGEFNNHR